MGHFAAGNRIRHVVRIILGTATAVGLAPGALLLPAGAAQAANPPPPPSATSKAGDSVTDPATNAATTVSSLVVDPNGTPTAGQTAFVVLADGNVVLVKSATAGDNKLYNDYDQTYTGSGGTDPKYDPAGTLTITAINGNA